MNRNISGSIVIYNTDVNRLYYLVRDLIKMGINLYLIDNSPIALRLEFLQQFENTVYIHLPQNPGFGTAHNVALKKAIESGSKYHFIINPDIIIQEEVIQPMIEYIDTDQTIGMVMPKVLNEDRSIQNLPKLLPSIFWVVRRKLKKLDPRSNRFLSIYELRGALNEEIRYIPLLSGCFTLLRLDAIKNVGMYDENFFMYFEDFDLSRRMTQKYKTIYYPKVAVIHGYEGGANKSWRLFKIYLKSMFTYFNKWGWIIDKERLKINKKTLSQFK